MRVVVVIEDSLPHRMVGAELTPFLWSLITDGGGWAADGGRAVLASSTYPNHASFVTGADVHEHRLFANRVWDGTAFVGASTVGPAVETIFDAARRVGISTSCVLGDQIMVGCMAADRADVHWPPTSSLPPGTATDSLGYAANSAVLDQVDELDALAAELCFVHMNEPDSALHLWGPDADETRDQIRRSDDDLCAFVERLRPQWDDTVLFVLSDHDQELIDHDAEPVRMGEVLHDAGLPGHALDEGTIALVVDGPGAEVVRTLPAIEDAIDLDDGATLAWSTPGRVFGRSHKTINGQHGSPRTATQVAVVAGGHPLVPSLADAIGRQRPYATTWAPTIAGLLGMPLPEASGRPLLP